MVESVKKQPKRKQSKYTNLKFNITHLKQVLRLLKKKILNVGEIYHGFSSLSHARDHALYTAQVQNETKKT